MGQDYERIARCPVRDAAAGQAPSSFFSKPVQTFFAFRAYLFIFAPENAEVLSESLKTGILLVNLGTPDSPATADVRRYLKQFLLDPRVIDIPALPRNLLVRGIIAPFRSPKSAKTYRHIWTKEGSPLLVISQKLAIALQEKLGSEYHVELAMRYQNPSLESVLNKFKGKAIRKLKVIPLFPQYASATTGSVHEEVMRILGKWQTIPPVELVNSYHDLPGMIAAFAANGRAKGIDNYDHVLFSYHGLPQRQLLKADEQAHCLKAKDCCATLGEKNRFCYSAQCHATTAALVGELGLTEGQYTTTFQSRLGRAEWIRPYTSDVIHDLAKKGLKRLLVFCPAFTADCLETIFEIGEEYREEFIEAGGEELTLVESVNTHPLWVEGLAGLAKN